MTHATQRRHTKLTEPGRWTAPSGAKPVPATARPFTRPSITGAANDETCVADPACGLPACSSSAQSASSDSRRAPLFAATRCQSPSSKNMNGASDCSARRNSCDSPSCSPGSAADSGPMEAGNVASELAGAVSFSGVSRSASAARLSSAVASLPCTCCASSSNTRSRSQRVSATRSERQVPGVRCWVSAGATCCSDT